MTRTMCLLLMIGGCWTGDEHVDSPKQPAPAPPQASAQAPAPEKTHPSVKLDEIAVAGASTAEVRKVIERDLQHVQDCYEKQIVVTKTWDLAGVATVEAEIAADGTARATGHYFPGVDGCMADALAAMKFPRGAKPAKLTVSFVCDPG